MLSHLPVFIENPQRVLLRDLRNFSIQRDRYLLDKREIDFDEPARKPDRVGQRAFGGVWETAVTRACEYVASLKRVYPHCWICKQRMSMASIARGSTATPWTIRATNAAARAATPNASCPRA